MSESDEESLVCRMVLPLPEDYCCYRDVSIQHPHLNFEVLGCMPLDSETMVEDVRVKGPGASEDLLQELRKSWDVKSAEVVRYSGNSTVHRLTLATCPIIAIHQDLHLLPTFPFGVKNGTVTMLVTGSPEQVRQMFARLKERIPDVTFSSIRRTFVDGRESLLTPRQVEVFQTALSAGYWDVPRRTNLTLLAEVFHVSKSTLHETIAQIENRLLHEVSEEHLRPLPF